MMKSEKYIEKIQSEQACSIATAEKLTRALHREGLLPETLVVRFRPLFGDFDIIEKTWFTEQKSERYIYVGKIGHLMEHIALIKEG